MLGFFGWVINLSGMALMFYGGVIGQRVYVTGSYGSMKVAHLPTLIFGSVLVIVGIMMILTKVILNAIPLPNGAKI